MVVVVCPASMQDYRHSYKAKFWVHRILDPLHNSQGCTCIKVSESYTQSDPGICGESGKLDENSAIDGKVFLKTM